MTSQQEQQKAERGEKTAENVRYGQTISEEGIGGKTTEAGGSANQGKCGSHVIHCDRSGNFDACLQTGSEQQMHREKQKMLKSPGRTRAMGQDLVSGHEVFRGIEEESELVTDFLLMGKLRRCSSSRSCGGHTPWR